MKPEEVPAELVERAQREYLPGLYDTGEEAMRYALAAVLPEYGARVLRTYAETWSDHDDSEVFSEPDIRDDVLGHAARLTARDHCDGGCINPGSGDCPTCEAAATEGHQ